MAFLNIVNKVLIDTGLGGTVDTVTDLDPQSDEGKVVGWVQDAQRDVIRDAPNAELRFFGNLSTVDDVAVADSFNDVDGDGEPDNGLICTNGSPTLTGDTGEGRVLTPDTDWVGRLLHIQGDSFVYRVKSVSSTSPGSITLSDHNGQSVNYRGTTRDGTSGYAVATIAQNRYLLPKNYKAPISFQDFFSPGTMTYQSPDEFDIGRFDEDSALFTLGTPNRFTIFATSMDRGRPRHYVEMRPIPNEVFHYPFRYYGFPTIMEADGDVSGHSELYEQAIIAKARSYVYRFAMRNEAMAAIEERDYMKIVNKQQTNPVQGRHAFQLHPQTSRDHWYGSYGG